MNFDPVNTLFIIPLTTGPVLLLAGILTLKFPPRKINPVYGYRTKSSKMSQERWDFAQKYSSRLMSILGVSYTALCIPGLFLNIDPLTGVFVSVGILIAVIILLTILTERAIKRKFGP